MDTISRRLVIGALILILLTSGCNALSRATPPPIGTILSDGLVTYTALPTNTLSNESSTPFIPITGMDVVSLQCQFCVNAEAHAILIMADFVNFNVTSQDAGVNCLTAQVANGRRILICHGPQSTSFNLNICTDSSNCLLFPITLQPCPLIPQTGNATPLVTFTPLTPYYLTPINTLVVRASRTPGPGTPIPTQATTQPPGITQTPPPATTPTPAATSTPEPPTQVTEPATTEPAATNPPTSAPTENPTNAHKKPTKTSSP